MWQPGWEGSLGENGYTCMYGWIPLWLNLFSAHLQLSQYCQPAMLLLFSHLIRSQNGTLQPHGLQHTRPPCPLPTPGVYLNSCPLCRWCHAAITSFDALFSSYPQSFLASVTFPMSWLFASGDQNTGVSASASVLPMNIQGWFSLRLNSLVSWLSIGLSGVFSSTMVQGHQLFGTLPSFSPGLTTFGKSRTFAIRTFGVRVMSLLFNTLSRQKDMTLKDEYKIRSLEKRNWKASIIVTLICSPTFCF